MSDAAHFFLHLYQPLSLIIDISSTAIKTAFFLAEILFGYTLAMKRAVYLAECSTKQADQPLDLAAASALRSWLAFATSGADAVAAIS